MFDNMPTLLTIFYVIDLPFAIVRVSGDNDQGVLLRIIHLAPDDVHEYAVRGALASPKIAVQDKDCLVIVAQRDGMAVVASQVYEIDLAATDSGYLLIPRGGFNVLCEQEEQLRESDLEKLCVDYERVS